MIGNIIESLKKKFIGQNGILDQSEIKAFSKIVKENMTQVDFLLNSVIENKDEMVSEIAKHIISSGGKRLRPSLTIACAKICKYRPHRNEIGRDIRLAASVELLHTATLLHDDVVDDSKVRRGKPTASDNYGNKCSILVGDFLLSQAFIIMVEDGSIEVLKTLSNTSAIISEGEVKQLSNHLQISKEEYLEIIIAKTAELFAASCEIGAIITNSVEETRINLREFGMNLGISFQIIDDILDYCSSKIELGKNIGDDFAEGKVTLPVIIATEKATLENNYEELEFWKRTMTDLNQNEGDFEKALKILESHNAIEESRELASQHANAALENLSYFEDSETKNALAGLLKFALKRKY